MSAILGATPHTTAIRREIVDRVLRDLLGPAEGPEEEVAEDRIVDRYLVGTLAPRTVDKAPNEVLPEELDKLETDGADSGEDGVPDGATAPSKTLFPSSFGMTFSVDGAASALRIQAEWGQYVRRPSEFLTKRDGSAALVWKRVPRGSASAPVPLRDGRLEPWRPDAACPGVEVHGRVRRRGERWSVTLFLVNQQEEPKLLKGTAWLFQARLAVEGPTGEAVFHRRPRLRGTGAGDPAFYADAQRMAMLYRRHVEFAVGHGVSVHATLAEGRTDRAVRLETTAIPSHETPRAVAPTAAEQPALEGLVCDMKVLSETPSAELGALLRPLTEAYAQWIEGLEGQRSAPDLADHQAAAKVAIGDCREALRRIEEGIRLLGEDETVAEAFRFANCAMWQQRIRSVYAQQVRREGAADLDGIDIPANRSWYPFQLAFVLLNLPGIADLGHEERTGQQNAVADLLWFPTGGGKTEAYLGLTAFTFAMRRLQGPIEGRSGEHGVAVLMRYTLRLLTIQQFQRATALVCACEAIRRADPAKWGQEPFRLGLWVGYRTTPNTTEGARDAAARDRGQGWAAPGRPAAGSPAQLRSCPWCGAEIEPGKHIRVDMARLRTVLYCGDPNGACPFSERQAPGEGLPALVVDEEIYRRLPALLIATVDKFAQMPWKGEVAMLFGQVDGRCTRHGFRSPEIEDADHHLKKGPLPAARTEPFGPVRPPDLIIQDELHLISGPLGTLVGLFETAVDYLSSWDVNGRRVRPKLIASTATIRRAEEQVHAAFLRTVRVFPAQGLDVADSFFSRERAPTDDDFGRLYLGVCAPGRRLKAALIRVYVAFLAAAQQAFEARDRAADPWMTLVGYFSSMRELGGMRRLADDDVRNRLRSMAHRGLANRSVYEIEELTSRRASGDIPAALDRLEIGFGLADQARRKARKRADRPTSPRPFDIVLATNMVSVGVDVGRLGLMVVAGQPKTTAEYIQATSRVGRRHPGIVCTVYNWARPRDLSHYESFEHYHATFYSHVEALSVTPFAPRAMNRGLTALLVSLVRLAGSGLNGNQSAGAVDRQHPHVQAAIDAIVARAGLVGWSTGVEDLARRELHDRLDAWLQEAQQEGRTLGYQTARDGRTIGLLRRPGRLPWHDFTCPTSLRDVATPVGLVLADWGGVDAPGEAADDGEEVGP